MSSNILFCDDRRLLGKIVIEAEYYGMENLLLEVKEKCYTNSNLKKLKGEQNLLPSQLLAEIEKEFPTAKDLIRDKNFPEMYYEEIEKVFNKIISQMPLPNDTYVQVCDSSYRAYQMLTYSRDIGSSSETIIEPVVELTARRVPWQRADFFNKEWEHCSYLTTQMVPISFSCGENLKIISHIHTKLLINIFNTCQKTILSSLMFAKIQLEIIL